MRVLQSGGYTCCALIYGRWPQGGYLLPTVIVNDELVWLPLFIMEEKLLVGFYLIVSRHLSLLDLCLSGSHSTIKLKYNIVTHVIRL